MNRYLWLPILALIGALCIGLGVYWLYRSPQAPSSQASSSQTPSSQAPSTNNISNEIVYTGNPEGLLLGTLAPGQTSTLTYLGGKIVTNRTVGWTSPIWGVPREQTLAGWWNGIPHKEMWTDALYVDLGTEIIPFEENQTALTVTNTSSQPQDAWLKINDSRFWEEGGQRISKNSNNQGDARFVFKIK